MLDYQLTALSHLLAAGPLFWSTILHTRKLSFPQLTLEVFEIKIFKVRAQKDGKRINQ